MLEISDEIETLNWQGIFDQNNFNPLHSLKVDNDLVYNRLLSSNYININPIEGLNLRSTFSIDYAQKQQNKYTPNDIYESERYGTQGEAKDDRDTRTVWQWDNSLSYEVSFGKHKLNAMVGTSYNPQIQISAESETKRSIFREKDKTKRSKKESAQHSKSRNKSFVMTSVSAL